MTCHSLLKLSAYVIGDGHLMSAFVHCIVDKSWCSFLRMFESGYNRLNSLT